MAAALKKKNVLWRKETNTSRDSPHSLGQSTEETRGLFEAFQVFVCGSDSSFALCVLPPTGGWWLGWLG